MTAIEAFQEGVIKGWSEHERITNHYSNLSPSHLNQLVTDFGIELYLCICGEMYCEGHGERATTNDN